LILSRGMQWSVFLVLLQCDPDLLSRLKSCGCFLTDIEAAAVVALGHRNLPRGFPFQGNLQHEAGFFSPVPGSHKFRYSTN